MPIQHPGDSSLAPASVSSYLKGHRVMLSLTSGAVESIATRPFGMEPSFCALRRCLSRTTVRSGLTTWPRSLSSPEQTPPTDAQPPLSTPIGSIWSKWVFVVG